MLIATLIQLFATRFHSVRRFLTPLNRSRALMYSFALPLLILAASTGPIDSLRRTALVVVGFSAIIFVHELGHFVVARLCSVRCDVFSIGIGPRMLGCKKGVGFSFGNEPDEKTKDKHPLIEGAFTGGDIEQSGSENSTALPGSKSSGCTDYRISWLPLGGYVRMLGQDDMDPTKISSDPNAFNNRPIWQRMCIVSAGVIMNVITAAIIFIFVFSHGIEFPPAYVGNVYYNSPAYKATYVINGKEQKGLQPGDQFIGINGKYPDEGFLEFTDVMISSALSTGTEPITYNMQRGDTKFDVAIKPEVNAQSGLLSIGVDPPKSMTFPEYTAEDLAKDSRGFQSNMGLFRSKDVIVAANGQTLDSIPDPLRFSYLQGLLQKTNGKPLALTLRDTAGKNREVSLVPVLLTRPGVDKTPPLLGFIPPVLIEDTIDGEVAAKGGILPGDIIARIIAVQWPTTTDMQSTVAANAKLDVSIDVLRGGKIVTIPPLQPALKGADGRIGVALGLDFDHAIVAGVAPDSPAAKLQLVSGSSITAINGTPVSSWKDIYVLLRDMPLGTLKVEIRDAGSPKSMPGSVATALASHTVDIPYTQADKDEVNKYTFQFGTVLLGYTKSQRAKTTMGAVIMGMEHTRSFILQTYATLRGLFLQTVPADQLHGIIGIAKVGHDIQDRGLIWLLYVLGMVSVNLAVANFLPLPIVDGGLFLLLIVEKIRGKPLSLNIQKYIQIVGLCLLGAMFLFVTKNDIGLFFK